MWPDFNLQVRVPWLRGTSPVRERHGASDHGSAATERPAGLRARCHIYTHNDTISVRFLNDPGKIIIGGEDGTVRRCKLGASGDDATEVEELIHSEPEGTNVLTISKGGRWIVLVTNEGRRIALWDTITRQRSIESVGAHDQNITALDISLDATKIASGSRDGSVIVWCLETGERFAGPFQQQQGMSVLSVRFSPHGDRLATTGWRSIYVWDVCNDEKVSVIPTDPAYSLAWSNDGTRLFTGCSRGSIMCFDLLASTPVTPEWRGDPHSDAISTLCVSNNGKFIISASRSQCCVKVWDVLTRSQLGSLEHSSVVLDAEVSPDDSLLVSCTRDGKIYLWDVRKVLETPYFFCSLTTSMCTSRSDTPLVLTEISNAAYVSWRNGDLARAEQILSHEIEHNSGPPSYHLADRALVRAQLEQWDRALDDAQLSLLVKPSLIARLAMSIAQSGCGHHNAAMGTLDFALENCDGAERNFVDVIKVITLFDSGSYDEAICHMNNVIVRSPNVERPCSFVLAKMYTSLAEDAINTQEYNKATSLFAQARNRCPAGQCTEMDVVSFVSSYQLKGELTEIYRKISGWTFDGLRLAIHQQLCEVYLTAGRTQEASDILRQMEDYFKHEIKLRRGLYEWLISFKSRCTEILENRGDFSTQNKDYHDAVAQYSAALDINPTARRSSTLVKRSEARAALCLWEGALRDADEAIGLSPSSPWGYERRQAALHGLMRYGDAIEASKAMISALENSPDPGIRQLRGNYVDPSDAAMAILDAAADSVKNSPFRLIDTTSGRLCDAEERKRIFKEDLIFQETVSSMITQLDHGRIDTATNRFFRYVMLSHRWEASELELADVLGKSIYDLDASPAATKLRRFCYLARDAKIRWAWSDTCCIDKNKDIEFEKSINMMFQWYCCSAATIVYLAGVPPLLIRGALKRSVWMTRGWTLQELLAPRIIRFYYDDWTPYLNNLSLNHKESADIMQELEDATGVAANDLLELRPGLKNIRIKLRLASTRETTEPVDMAYGLFGLFGVKMPVIRGESQQHALGRLFQEIVARSGDVTCLAWVGQPSEFNSAFPDHLRVYEHASRTVPHIAEGDMETQVVTLRRAWTPEEELRAIAFYQRLDKLPAARCTSQHLHLPCIVFPVTTLRRVKQSEYRATTRALEDTDIYSKILLNMQAPENLILVCPWIDELMDAGPRHHEETNSDSQLKLEQEQDPSALELAFSSSPFFDLGPGTAHMDTTAVKASRLAVRFRQSLGALLLQVLGRGQYRRVATKNEIIIRVRDDVSFDNLILETLEIR